MIQFLSPLGFISLLALSVPIAIHLLSRKPGKTIKIGSLQFLESAESRQLKSFKLTEIPLLLLRAALLATLASLLAQPYWLKKIGATAAKPHGWILVAPELIRQPHGPQIDHQIDSLVAAGNELHLLAPGFPAASSWQNLAIDNRPTNIWSLLREVDNLIPANMPVWIFLSDRLAGVHGERPTLKRSGPYYFFSQPRENCWIPAARFFTKDSLQLTLGFSNSQQTNYSHFNLLSPNRASTLSGANMPAVEIIPASNGQSRKLHLVASDAIPADNDYEIPAQVDSIAVAILYDQQRQEDARYVQTALETVAEFGRIPMVITSEQFEVKDAEKKYNAWVFWLSPQPIPQALFQQIEQGLRLLSDAASQEYDRAESIMVMGDVPMQNFSRLARRVAANNSGITLWTDGFGEPLLECANFDKGRHYRFHSRFNPAWNGLVLSAAFPEWLLSLLTQRDGMFANKNSINRFSDLRRISARQAQPQSQAAEMAPAASPISTSLHFPILIIAIILFACERWLAERKIT
jgi:hypothetical protein